jgi:RHS repeat-associated protein
MAIAGESWTFTQYTTHPLDPVLNVYLAQARMYDAVERRFMAADPLKGSITNSATQAQYTYCLNSPLVYTDIFGLQENPVDALKKIIDSPGEIDSYKFKDDTYYYIREVFDILGGTVDYGEKSCLSGKWVMSLLR